MGEERFVHHDTRVVIRGYYGRPAVPSFSLNVLGEKLLRSAQAKDHLQDIRRLDLKRFDIDDLDDRVARALALDWDPTFEDRFNRLEDWETLPSQQETELRQARLADLKARLAEILAIAEDARTEDQKDELDDLEENIDRMDTTGPGFLESVPNAFGDGTAGMYSPLNEPYVPSRRRSKWYAEEDSPFCVGLYWYEPNEAQATWHGDVQWSRYRLRFGLDRVEFFEFRKELTPAQIDAKETELESLLDDGRITHDDTQFKQQQKDKIKQIKADAKKEHRTGKKLLESEKQAIADAKKAIDDRWKAKRRREGAQNTRIRDLRKELYVSVESVDLGQPFEGFFGNPLILTIIPQRRGYITIVLEGGQAWSHEIKDITKTHQSGTVWKRSRVNVGTNGGAYKWAFGWPEPKSEGAITIGPFDPGYDIDGVDYSVGGHWDGEAQDGDDDQAAHITWDVQPVPGTPPVRVGNVMQQRAWQITGTLKPAAIPPDDVAGVLTSRQIPLLYDAFLYIPAGERDGSDAVVWDSVHLTEGCPTMDILPTWNNGALTCKVILRASETSWERGISELDNELQNFPRHLDGRMCDLYVTDVAEDSEPYIARGIIRQPDPKYVGSSAPGDLVAMGAGTVVEFLVQDHWALLQEPFAEAGRPVGDGQDLGEHVKTILRSRGERENEVSGIPDEIGVPLRGAPPGEGFLQQPARGAQYATYLRDLLDAATLAGPDLELYWSGDENSYAEGGFWVLAAIPETVLTIDGHEVNFTTDPDAGTRYFVREALDIPDDDSELFNVFPVEGARDPETKEPIVRTWLVWESILVPGDLRFIGRDKAHPLVRIATLRSEDEVLQAARRLASKRCKSTRGRRIRTGFIRPMRPGLKTKLDGRKIELVRCTQASAADDTMEWVTRLLET